MSRPLLLLLLLHAFVGWRLVPHLQFVPAGALAVGAWLVASAALIAFGFHVHRRGRRAAAAGRPTHLLLVASYVALGAFSSLFVLTLLRDLALLIVALIPGDDLDAIGPLSVAQASAALVASLAGALTVRGWFNARGRARVRCIDIPIANLPPALQNFTIAQITDLHVGPTIRRAEVERIVDTVNSLDADVVAITGDVVDGSVPDLAPHVEPLGRLRSREGTLLVTGNHEYYSGARAWIAEFRRLGLGVLLNEHRVVRRDDAQLVLAGVTDYSAHHFEASHRSDPAAALRGAPAAAAARILLAHQPRSAAGAAEAGFDLQISGHTHGGQFLPWIWFVRLQQPYTAGLHRLRQLWIYVSRGTGYWGPPKRLGAPAEVTRLRLVRA